MKTAFFLILFSLCAIAQTTSVVKILVKDFSIELELLVEHLNLHRNKAQSIPTHFESINEHLGLTDRTNAQFLIKSEIHKGLLANQFLEFSANTPFAQTKMQDLKAFQQKFEQHKNTLSAFSRWILSSIIMDIEQAQSSERSSKQEVRQAKMGQRLGPWISFFLKTNPKQFETKLALIGSDIVKNIAFKSALFKNHGPTAADDQLGTLFAVSRIPAQSKQDQSSPSTDPVKLNSSQAVDALINQEELDSKKDKEWTPR